MTMTMTMKQIVRIFDNGGDTMDRYTVVIDDSVYNMSENPTSFTGVNMYAGELSQMKPLSEWDDKPMGSVYDNHPDLPSEVKEAIFERMELEIALPCSGIKLFLSPDKERDGCYSGSITSELYEKGGAEVLEHNAAVDGLESVILGHACAGIDVSSPAYVEGIMSAETAIGNNF